MADAGGTLEGWKAGWSQDVSSSLALPQATFLIVNRSFQGFSFCQTSFLSLVPVSLVAIALASAIVLALIEWPCCLDSGNFISSFHPFCPVGDSGFLLLPISGWSCHFHVRCLSRLSPVQRIPSVKFPIWNTWTSLCPWLDPDWYSNKCSFR